CDQRAYKQVIIIDLALRYLIYILLDTLIRYFPLRSVQKRILVVIINYHVNRVDLWFLDFYKISQQSDEFTVLPVHQEVIHCFVDNFLQVPDVILQPEIDETVQNDAVGIVEIVHEPSDD